MLAFRSEKVDGSFNSVQTDVAIMKVFMVLVMIGFANVALLPSITVKDLCKSKVSLTSLEWLSIVQTHAPHFRGKLN